MAQRHQQLIDQILDEKEEARDHSLQGAALERATRGGPPKTLTPWEWLEYYEQHGVPETHATKDDANKKPWWKFWG